MREKGEPVNKFGQTAIQLSKNPLGIIALFIVLVYGFASFVTATSGALTPTERAPLIYFLVLFPVLVLGLFGWIVIYHPVHLFGPRDFRDEENYVTLVASLTAASIKRPDGQAIEPAPLDVHKIAETVRNVSVSVTEAKKSSRRVLWVDDSPENNVLERQAFEAIGLSFTLALSTAEALKRLESESIAAIISDMGRKEGPQEGYVLLSAVRAKGDQTPFFIYASSGSSAHRREAAKRGAQGSTNDPQELFQLVTSALLSN